MGGVMGRKVDADVDEGVLRLAPLISRFVDAWTAEAFGQRRTHPLSAPTASRHLSASASHPPPFTHFPPDVSPCFLTTEKAVCCGGFTLHSTQQRYVAYTRLHSPLLWVWVCNIVA